MAAIADVYVTILPETSKIAAGIQKALRDVDDDVRAAAKRWRRDIERELGRPEVEVDADTTTAKRELDKLEKDKHTAHIKVEVDQAA